MSDQVVAIFFVVYQQLENYLLVPRVMRNTVDISAIAVLLSALGGATVLGALMAIPIAAAVKVVLTSVTERHTELAPPAVPSQGSGTA